MKIQFNKRQFYPVMAGLFLVFGFLAVQLSETGVLKSLQQRLEWLAYNVRLNASLPEVNKPDPRIVIVDIDEKSLKAEGRWPWSREKIANLVDRLFEKKVAVVAFDVLFAEPEVNPAQRVLDKLSGVERQNVAPALQGVMAQLDADAKLAAKLKGRDVVLAYSFGNEHQEAVGQLPQPLANIDSTVLQNSLIPLMSSYSANLPRLQQATRYGGFINADPDEDGILRRSPLVKRYGDKLYASLGMEAVRAMFANEAIKINTVPLGDSLAVESVRVGGYDIPTDAEGRIIIPYRGPSPSFPYVSATDVLHGAVPELTLENTIVFVGTTASALMDLRSTPMQAVYPGVEVHASIASGILDHRFPSHPAWAEAADFLGLLILGLALSLLLPMLSPLRGVLLSVALAVAIITGNAWLWRAQGLVMNVATPVILLFMLTLLNMAYGFLSEARGRTLLKGMFGQYVPPELVEEMSRNPQNFGFQGDSREMTVLFADIRGFTTISESLSAGDLKKLLNEFFTPMTRIIFNRRGTIDKYVGDMIMAFWGAPLPDDQHAAHAIDAALDMLAEVESLKPKFRSLGLPEINIGIGINTGVMNVGDMGSEFRRAYTVIGDAVNLASRLEGLTKFYGVSLIVGENTQREQDDYVFQLLDRVNVKGKNQTVDIYQPLCRVSAETDDLLAELALHEQALFFYFSQKWTAARAAFSTLQRQRPDKKLYSLFLERLDLLESLPQDSEWSGAFQHEHK